METAAAIYVARIVVEQLLDQLIENNYIDRVLANALRADAEINTHRAIEQSQQEEAKRV